MNKLEVQLERAERNEKFNRNWALEEQQKYEELERSLPQKIKDAVNQALASLQNKYNSLKKQFKETKDKLEQKTADYEALEEKYSKMSKDYRALKSASSQVENLQWENKLMYTLLKTLHQSERIDKCRTAHAKGRVSIEEKLIFGKEKSQQKNSQKITTSQRSYTSQNRLIER